MADLPGYPENDLTQGRDLLIKLGSFWSEIFGDREVLQAHLHSSAQEQAQVHLTFLEAVASVSRFTVPVFHKEDWYLLTFKRSEADATASVYKTGDLVYGPQLGTVTGRPYGFIQKYGDTDRPDQVRLVLPSTLVDAPVTLQNLVVNPSRVLVKDLDYDIETRVGSRVIRFRSDPFTDDLIPRRDIVDANGAVVDTEIALWIYRGDFDLEYIYTQFGYVLGLKMTSAQFYKDLLNAIWDSFVLGFSRARLESFLSAISGAPIILEARETVELIRDEGDSTLVVTDSNVYRVPLGGVVLLTEQETYLAGTPVSDIFQINELSGNNPTYDLLPAMAFSKSLLSGQFLSELFMEDKLAQVEYGGLDADGKAFVKFEVSGFPADVEAFWQAVQTRGKAAGATLANLLDTRTNPVGEPGPADLPTQINPLEFMLDNLLRNNLFLLRIKPGAFDPSAPGLSLFNRLREIMPPHTTYIVFIELLPAGEQVDLSQSGDENEPGAEDSAGLFHGAGLVLDELYERASAPVGDVPVYDDVVVAARQISFTCQ